MFRTPTRRRPARRRGTILLVVLTLLALFAVIGLSFAFYAESSATQARIAREAVARGNDQPPDPTEALNKFLGQLVYPVPDTGPDTLSALRGHELARQIYGFDGRPLTPPPVNNVPYNGHGLYHENIPNLPMLGAAGTPTPPFLPPPSQRFPIDRAQVINFSLLYDWWNGKLVQPGMTPNHLLFDPEYTYPGSVIRTGPTVATDPVPANAVYVGKNAPYTYPDRNNAAVALVDPNTGQVIIPSFHRPSLFGSLDQSNPNWYTQSGRFKILRPRRIDHLTEAEKVELRTRLSPSNLWPIPENPTPAQLTQIVAAMNSPTPLGEFPDPQVNPDGTRTGDVQNLRFANGIQKADSLWLDFNGPVSSWRGRRIKPLVAALVVPLDGRINLNVAGNRKAADPAHRSNMGFAPHELNLLHVLNPATATTSVPALVTDRYGTAGDAPNPPGVVSATSISKPFHADPFQPFDVTFQTRPQNYALVDWDAAGSTAAMTMPNLTNGSQYSSVPNYPPAPGYGNSDATEATAHPGLFNPFQWAPRRLTTAATPNEKTFPVSDLRRLAGRYSDKASTYNMTFLGTRPTFGAEFTGSSPNNPSNITRALTTSMSNSLKRPILAPNFFGNPDPAASFQQAAATPGNFPPPPTLGTRPTFDVATITSGGWTGGDSQNAAPASMRNLRAVLAGVDINRPLADYRDPATRPLDPTTTPWPLRGGDPGVATVTDRAWGTASPPGPGSLQLAWRDRQMLAWEIFARLVVATGASAVVDATVYNATTNPNGLVPVPQASHTPFPTRINVVPTVAPGTPEFNALRWLAQLAANIVDYIDNDDIATPFVWNPQQPADRATTPIDPYDPAYFATTPATAPPINERVVFGVEKPRLVLNEVYAEVANLQGEAGGGNPMAFQVRFFLELLNPGSAETDLGNPLYYDASAPGAVPLRYTGATPVSCYRVQVFRQGSAVSQAMQNPNNVLGYVADPAAEQRIEAPLGDGINATTPTLADRIEPNGGAPSADPTTGARNGFGVIGPQLDPPMMGDPDQAYVPDPMLEGTLYVQKPGDGAGATTTPANALQYQEAGATDANLMALTGLRHAVVLQRLACPYLPALPYNPYITVDYVTHVQAHDVVGNLSTGGNPPAPRPPPQPPETRSSIGRVQPYTGNEGDGAADPISTTSFTQSLTLKQQNAPGGMASGRQISLFRHNYTDPTTPPATGFDDTLRGPFEWLIHLDRRLVSPTELVHVAGVKPHELTHRFALPDATSTANPPRPKFHLHDLQHPAFATAGGLAEPAGPLNVIAAAGTGNSPLYRALEALAVKPFIHGLPEGGRVPGKVNINMLWDENPATGRSRVFDAIMDRQAGNSFTDADLTAIWTAIKQTRSPGWTPGNPTVRPTNDEVQTATPGTDDRPFKSFGSAMLNGAPGVVGAWSPTDIADTLLRSRLTPDPDGVTRPVFSRVGPAPAPGTTPLHPYHEFEPLRKALNSLTTVSDNYMVVLTVGFFEVRQGTAGDPSNPPVLGKEVYDRVPGDMRHRFFSIVDRTQLGIELDNTGSPILNADGSRRQAAGWYTELTVPPSPTSTGNLYIRFVATGGDANSIQLHYDGQDFTIAAGNLLRLGTGANAETVAVQGLSATDSAGNALPAFDPTTGLATVTLAANPTRTHFAGEAVTNNVLPGNPGPPPVFNFRDPQQQSVIRYVGRLSPIP